MKNIHTLIPDIYDLIRNKEKGWFDEQLANALSHDLSRRLQRQLGEATTKPTLRLSQMGPRCPCALWHSIYHPELAEPLPPWAEIKYSFGHVVEALAITLAKATGHSVVGEQDALELDGIVGHRDCVIDGCTVDVKSASSISFQKFKSKDFHLVDNFGYLDQLDGYCLAAANDPLVTVKDKGYILAVDKQLGHMCLYEHEVNLFRQQQLKDRILCYREIVARNVPPACECKAIPDGSSGNLKLDTKASYNLYKWSCNPGLRCFLYAKGPVYLTKVVRKPDVAEIDRFGNFI